VVIAVVSVPASGSVTPNATCRRPATTSGRYCSRSVALPCFTTGFIPKIDVWSALQPFIAAPDAATSSSTIDASVMPWPPPP
jgi:hypothetical protein